VLGSAAIQLAMFLALFWVDAPKQPFVVEPYDGANAEVSKKLLELKDLIMGVHAFCFVGLVFIALPFTRDVLVSIGRIFGVLAMLIQVLTLSLVMQQIFTAVDPNIEYTADFAKFHHWFQIEVAVTLSCILSLAVFLFIRSFFRQRGVQMNIGGSFSLPQTDFLDAQLYMTSIITSMTVPFVIVHFMQNRIREDFPGDTGIEVTDYQLGFALSQVVMVYYLTFVGYHKTPEWAGMVWINIAPWISLLFLLLCMLIIPIMVCVHTIANLGNIHSSVFQGPLLIYPFISTCIVIQFPIYILPRLKKGGEFVQQKKAKMATYFGLKKNLNDEFVEPVTSINDAKESLLPEDRVA
jgi:hypothetical protein